MERAGHFVQGTGMKATGRGPIGSLMRLFRQLPIILLGIAITCPSVYAADDAKPNFIFFDGAAANLSPDSSDAFKFDVPIKNAGGKEGQASIKLLPDKDQKCGHAKFVVKPKASEIRLPPNGMTVPYVELTNVSLPATCYIELTTEGEGGNTSLKQIKLTQQYLTSSILYPLFYCLCISVAVAGFTWLAMGMNIGKAWPNFKLGAPAWDFAKSWTSTTTLASAIITTALTLSALPELTKYASKSGYSALALLISFVVVVAPFLFLALRMGTIQRDPLTKMNSVVQQGYLLSFLVSCTITLFAGLAQLVVLFLLLDEIFLGYRFWSFSSSHAPWSMNIGTISTYVLGAALCWYVANSMYLTFKMQATTNDEMGDSKAPLLSWQIM
jgi:hypothetical protein